jgi:hypothetical protein
VEPSGGDCEPFEEAIMDVVVAGAAMLGIGKKTLSVCHEHTRRFGGRRQFEPVAGGRQDSEVAMEATGSTGNPS